MADIPRPKRSPLLGIVVGVLAVIVILTVVLFVDPFKWNALGNIKVLLGLGGDPVAASVPAKPTLYLGVDLLNIQPDKLNRIYKPFAAIIDPAASPDANSGLKDLDKQMKDSIGITITDDIMPWAGRSAGLAVKDIKLNSIGTLSSMTLILSIQSRDNARADEFLTKLKASLEEKSSFKFVQVTYSGVTIYSYTPAGGSINSGLAYARSGDVVLFSLNEAGIQAAIDAQKGDSMAKDSGYQALLQQLPADRFMTMYINMQGFADLMNQSSTSTGLSSQMTSQLESQFKTMSGGAVSISIVDAGLQMDSVVAYNLDKMTPEEQKVALQFKGPVETVKMLPENTLFFVGVSIANSSWLKLTDSLASLQGATASEFEQSMSQLEQTIGINPSKDLFPYLDGEFMLAGMPSTEGLLKLSGLNFGAAVIIQTSDSKKIMDAVDKVYGALKSAPDFSISPKSAGDLSYYAVVEPQSEQGVLALGVGKQYLVFATSPSLAEGLFSGKSSLANSSRYQTAAKTLPGGSTVSIYVDLEGLFAKIRETIPATALKQFNQSVKFFEPIPSIVMGSSVVGQNMAKATFVILVTAVK